MKALPLTGGFAVFALIALAIALAWRSADQDRIDELAKSTNTALCAFKFDLQQRADSTAELLRENPGDPIRIFGLEIPRAQLESNLINQKRSLMALATLECG